MMPARNNRALSLLNAVLSKMSRQIGRAHLREIYAQVCSYTMVDKGTFCDNLLLAERVQGIQDV